MRYVAVYPIVVTDRLRECRDFYCRWFGFQVGFEASWFVWRRPRKNRRWPSPSCIRTTRLHRRHRPPSRDGMFLTLQVADAQQEYQRLSAAGLRVELALRDEAWGQRRFGVVDPAGMWSTSCSISNPSPAAGPHVSPPST